MGQPLSGRSGDVWVSPKIWEAAEQVILRAAAPEGATDCAAVTASLKRCPDTNRAFFSSLLENMGSAWVKGKTVASEVSEIAFAGLVEF
jgi:hypothetical protein